MNTSVASSVLSRFMGGVDWVFSYISSLHIWLKPHRQFFVDGFGDLELVQKFKIIVLDVLKKTVPLPSLSSVKWIQTVDKNTEANMTPGSPVIEIASFPTPFPQFLPESSSKAFIQVIRPAGTAQCDILRVAVHMQMTGDENFDFRRVNVAIPLLKHGVVSVLLIAPMYGKRRPENQHIHFFRTVSLMIRAMLCCLIEGAMLVDWSRQIFQRSIVAITGISYGGAVAAGSGAFCSGPLAIIPCLSPSSSRVMVSGSLSNQIAWQKLSETLNSNLGVQEFLFALLQDSTNIAHIADAVSQHDIHREKVCVATSACHDHIVNIEDAKHLYVEMQRLIGEDNCIHRWIPGGHVVSIASARSYFVPSILDGFELLEMKRQNATKTYTN